jgi:hypothetical protein
MPDSAPVPDARFIHKGRKNRVGDTERGYVDGAPDITIKVLSPSDQHTAVARKAARFLAAGMHLVRVLDPEAEADTGAIYRPGQDVEAWKRGRTAGRRRAPWRGCATRLPPAAPVRGGAAPLLQGTSRTWLLIQRSLAAPASHG